jgi:glucan phosphoethanolaminetransferase (alkaline phosphatase superfamily)
MPLSARYRLYALGAVYLAPYVAMLVWCSQDYKLRSMLALGLTAALGALLLAGVTRTWRRFFLAYLPLLVLSIAYAGYSLSYGIMPGHTLSIVLVSASAEEGSVCWQFGPEMAATCRCWRFLLIRLVCAATAAITDLRQQDQHCGARNPGACNTGAGLRGTQRRSSGRGMALHPIVGSVMFFAGQIPRAEREIHGFNVHKAPFHASRPQTNPEVHILIIGESARRASWSVYGYERPTTPYLEKIRPELFLFQHAITDANLTSLAVPILLTGLGPEEITSARPQGNILDLAKEVGYSTSWLVNQDLGVSTAIGVTADNFVFPPDPHTSLFGRHVPDEALLPALRREVERSGSSRFIAIHVMGSHWEYYLRYGPKFQRYGTLARMNSISMFNGNPRVEADLRDTYDNTVLYTDWFLQQVIEATRQLAIPATVTFVPDHGESVAALDDGAGGHGGPDYFASQFEIPGFVWLNEAYKSSHPEKVAALQANVTKEIRSHDFFYTLADLMGITWPDVKPERSFAAASFVKDRTSKHLVGGVLKSIPEPAENLVSQR